MLETLPRYKAGFVTGSKSKGKRTAIFQPNGNPDLKIDGVGYFALEPNGELYQLVFPHELARYVIVYKSDGTSKSAIKLQPGFPWMPATLAAFPSGDLLVSGLEYDRDTQNGAMWPQFSTVLGGEVVGMERSK